ncbi:MAG: hypothetical protein GWO07_01340 [Candidatus Dadabacteria bacterium]|nr:hypothetical protein [Candidatus Dadabacteria bacterium]NIS07418.1 hypothetical protein [Candidatus Dadabacteria bacterium]NIV41608.1 hypothetical protein [Candidatus Dadabacteria bacterium]NIX14611.1 hypothetical protein [Candidatus Dadabacteria bacterium]NIY21074.1 hypothetical protein [Candidatus Dadabacteria bacterium]
MTTAKFAELISMLRSDDPLTYEDGYHGLLNHVDEFLDEMISLEQSEADIK